MKRIVLLSLVACVGGRVAVAQKAEPDEVFSRKNTFSVYAETSNSSSHILLGASRQRHIEDLGFGYSRRLLRFNKSEFSYHAEIRPVLFESDPLTIDNYTVSYGTTTQPLSYSGTSATTTTDKCVPSSGTVTYPPSGTFPGETVTYNITCGRQYTFGQAFSPLGFRWSLLPHRPVQPYVQGTLGYMYTSRPVPIAEAEGFNFIFDFGPGVEVYREKGRSVAVEALYSHFSNNGTAQANPGVDNLVFKVVYSFGR